MDPTQPGFLQDVLAAHKAACGVEAGAKERLHALVLGPGACTAMVNAVADTLEDAVTLKVGTLSVRLHLDVLLCSFLRQ